MLDQREILKKIRVPDVLARIRNSPIVGLRDLGKPTQWRRMFNFLDLDANGLISWDEFEKCCRAMCNLDTDGSKGSLAGSKKRKRIPKNIKFDQHGRAHRVNLIQFEVE